MKRSRLVARLETASITDALSKQNGLGALPESLMRTALLCYAARIPSRHLRDGKITDEARRRIEYELDLEEAGVNNRAQDGGGWI